MYKLDKMGIQLHYGDIVLKDDMLRRIKGIRKDNMVILETLSGKPAGIDFQNLLINYQYLPANDNEMMIFLKDKKLYNAEIVAKKYLKR